MKKLLRKYVRRREPVTPSRVTNDTVAEHREQILAGGRKFKYPIQYARHKLVINAVIVASVAAVLLLLIGWWQLYPMQNSSRMMYRLTRLVPVPVAVVNGEQVPYRDYLVQYRASEYYLGKYGDTKLDTDDGRRQLDYIKRQSLTMAEQVAYARQLARERQVTVSSKDVDEFIDQERNTANGRVSQETYDASIQMLYDQPVDDYRLTVANGILKNKVAFAVDETAKAQVEQAKTLLKDTNGDFAKVAEGLANSKGGKVTVGETGLIGNANKYGGLRVSEVSKLEKGAVSEPLMSTTADGYYFVKVIDKNDTQVNFTYIHIPLTTFTSDFAKLKEAGKINEFISVSETKS